MLNKYKQATSKAYWAAVGIIPWFGLANGSIMASLSFIFSYVCVGRSGLLNPSPFLGPIAKYLGQLVAKEERVK